MKKIFTLIVLSMIAFNTIHAEITWTLSDDGTLTISGSNMPQYSSNNVPWLYDRDRIKKVIIEKYVTNVGQNAFRECRNLTSVTIPNSVTSIGGGAFSYCSSLISITFPNSVKTIGVNAFIDCSALNSINIPESVTNIGEAAFLNCSSLTSIAIPNSVTNIGKRAFAYCSSLTSITVEKENTRYDSRENCNAIIETKSNILITGSSNTIIPNSVTSIGDYAFVSCLGLTSITIPNSVKSIGKCAFSACSGLTSIIVEKGNTRYDSRENCNAIIDKYYNTLISGCKNTIIPNSVTTIGEGAFAVCSGLTSITIPNSVKSIETDAFISCSDLTSIILPNSIKNIGDCAFDNCSGLTSITIPNSVTNIGVGAFEYCSGLTSITIPNSVTSIGQGAFYGCSGLTSITCEASYPPSSNGTIFYKVNEFTPVYVPANSVEAYKKANGWMYFTNIQAIIKTEDITFANTNEKCALGKTKTLTTIFSPENATNKIILWTSSNTDVATVSSDGIVTAKSLGTTVITAKTNNDKTATCVITVEQAVNSITLSDETSSLWIGNTKALTAIVSPTTANNTAVEWYSSDNNIATVSSEGVITTKNKGTCTITCSAADGYGTSSICKVIVKEPVTAIALSDASTPLWVGDTKTITATATPTTASNPSVEWYSSDDNVASVSCEGMITAKGKGTCTITCTAADGYGTKTTCEVTVKQQVTEIALSETNASLWVGDTKTLTATASPTNANNTSVEWSSSDDNVATVSSEGIVTAKGQGTCTITCTAADGYGTKSICEVTVKQQVTEIALNETTASLWVGDTKTITATASPTTASNTSVEWYSSDDNVASVSSEGMITAKGKGSCIITCTASDGYGTKSTCEVIVKQQVTEIALSETNASLWVGDTKTITATASPTTASNTSVEWSSSDENIASVSSEGVITANGEGSCIITCTAADGYGTKSTCEVTVKQQVTEIVLSETTVSLCLGDTKTITATAILTTAGNTDVIWSSSDDNVATVSPDGIITAKGEGTCTITCTAADGYGTFSVCEVTVMQQTTSLEDLRFANDKSPVYNQNGQRINKAHAKKGIYIKNGKKYANKN